MSDTQSPDALPTVTQEILDSFYMKLQASDEIDEEATEELRSLLSLGKKATAADLIAVFERRNQGLTS